MYSPFFWSQFLMFREHFDALFQGTAENFHSKSKSNPSSKIWEDDRESLKFSKRNWILY